jgi:hypothetical protein
VERRTVDRGVGVDILIDECVKCIEENNTCSNDFYEYYIDREGYHSVNIKGVE